MSVLSLLEGIASEAIMTPLQRQAIEKSYNHLVEKIKWRFGNQVAGVVRFGSSTRGTMLPLRMDPETDVDCMIVFADPGLKPKSYIDRLMRFAEETYGNSLFYQDYPTAVVELDHIKFELVPAIMYGYGSYKIPAKWLGRDTWAITNPEQSRAALELKDSQNANLLRPLIRIMKYWNSSGYDGQVFPSFELEEMVARQNFLLGFTQPNLRSRFYSTVNGLPLPFGMAQWKISRLKRIKELVSRAAMHEFTKKFEEAEACIAMLFP